MTERIGGSARRPDGTAKATGTFTYANDLIVPGMLHGATVRCPHPHARLVALDVTPAYAVAGVVRVATSADVPGNPCYGLDVTDQAVFVSDVARYHGEPVAAVAAETRAAAEAGARAVVATWEVLAPLTDPELAVDDTYRHLVVEHGDPEAEGDVVVEGDYVIGVQDQAFLAPEAALAVPAADGGVDLTVATQWLHVDQRQVADCLALPSELVRVTLGGVGGAFGGREDVTLQVHCSLLAMLTGKPVKMVYTRQESFLGHVHRHPARMHYRHTATRDGRLVSVSARILLDGGAYQSSSWAVVGNATTMAAGPYAVPNARLEGLVVRTNNPPNGAMRGFGVVQVCAGHEAQMDRLAAALDMDPLQLREINAVRPGDRLPTGQEVVDPSPAHEVLAELAQIPLPARHDEADELLLPGGQGRCADPARVRRGIGIALGYKNIAFSEGYDDPSTAHVRLEVVDGTVRAVVRSACAEVGQGFVTLARQIVRSELGVDEVELLQADTSIASAGSTSAARQTWVSGGAVRMACAAVADELRVRAAGRGVPAGAWELLEGRAVASEAGESVPLGELVGDGVDAERTYRHHPTTGLDARGQGSPHVAFAYVAHRAVVDVDLDLGTSRLVQLATAQDVGRALSPLGLLGQVEGGSVQGAGLALMEELVLDGGRVLGPGFGDYLLPTTLDVPDVDVRLVEVPDPRAPYGAKGVGEAPHVSSPAAVVAALRAATGNPLTRLPVRPEDLVVEETP
ncbi:xanthine dehydrogenase molybdenum binding subunit apoprotein [Motilibacter rhizosphaerae]|uniref:Xanthine dehydrogenase molybdenum binding subunit apoprotein n=1 Tax=Motilibacter rhizosphaerae TaxID=598652 RepID=A0A4Q7NZ38_9ACTN|nr:xanthine dehydrogenase subunit D [Motilibacter rhizosphaerae]RZS91682.1 xanthine dehydrogenase molybdenum binding subunit apoprotein [Motilibacter rhizosphaerae]